MGVGPKSKRILPPVPASPSFEDFFLQKRIFMRKHALRQAESNGNPLQTKGLSNSEATSHSIFFSLESNQEPTKMEPSDDTLALHDRQVNAVAAAVAKLLPRLAGECFTPEAIFEGSVRGGAVALLAGTSADANDVAILLETLGESFRNLDRPKLHVVG